MRRFFENKAKELEKKLFRIKFIVKLRSIYKSLTSVVQCKIITIISITMKIPKKNLEEKLLI